MESSQSRWIVGMAVALVVVVSVLLVQGRQPEPADPDATVRVWQLEADLVDRIALRRAGAEPAVLNRSGEEGWTTADGELADSERVARLLDALSRVERGVQVEEPGPAEDYGLGDPASVEVTLTLRSGLDRVLRVGTKVPTGYRTYAQVPGGPILAVQGDLPSVLDPGPTGWHDPKVFRFEPGQARRVVIESAQGTLDMEGQGTDWVLHGYGRADPDAVDDVVMGLLDMRFDAYLDGDQVVGDPRYVVTVTEADGDVHSARIGASTPMGITTSTRDGRFGAVFEGLVEQLGRGPNDVGDPRAFPVDLERADEVTVEGGEQRFYAVRNGPSWGAPTLDEGAAWRGIQALSEVAATYRSEPPAGRSTGTGRVTVRSGDEERTVQIGERVDDFWVATDPSGGGPYRVVAEDLGPALEALGLQ